jgi:hypothetical protein
LTRPEDWLRDGRALVVELGVFNLIVTIKNSEMLPAQTQGARHNRASQSC